jgi:hypothetical protein
MRIRSDGSVSFRRHVQVNQTIGEINWENQLGLPMVTVGFKGGGAMAAPTGASVGLAVTGVDDLS